MYAHGTSSHIPQPPHSAGVSYKGLRAAIDPHQIPSPIEVIEGDRDVWEGKTYPTLPGSHVPLSTTDYVALDQGNSSPKFVRFSTWNIPSSSKLASACEIPIVAVIQPFATLNSREDVIPVVATTGTGPARCERCRAYINPWCRWLAGGAKWKCNLCEMENQVSPEYFSNLDANLMRLDHMQRPELIKGTVDFDVPEEYWAPHPIPRIEPLYQPVALCGGLKPRQPSPMDVVFAIEVTEEAIKSGLTQHVCQSLDRLLYGEDDTGQGIWTPPGRICIVTFDSVLHFYDLALPGRIAMLVVADVENVFVPSSDGLFIDAMESRDNVRTLLTTLSRKHEENLPYGSSLGAAALGCLCSLAGRGGQAIIFAATSPTQGPGTLQPRDDESSLYESDKELTLYSPRNEFWKEVGEQCAEEGIGINMFLAMSRPIDVATLGCTVSASGGELFFHPRFDPVRDGIVLKSQLTRVLSRVTGYNCAMRVRCSAGLRVVRCFGNFSENAAGDMQFGTLDEDAALCLLLDHTHTLDDRQFAFVQSAVLYTSTSGKRRVRVCNVALQVVSLAGSVFRNADMDAVVSYMIREAVSKLPTQKVTYIQEELTEKCSTILLGYRKNCAAATAPSQLIIPEAFRALPAYTLSMMKTKPLKARNVTADVRTYWVHKFLRMSVRSIMQHLYPRLLALHDLDDEIALPRHDSGTIEMPSLMRNSHLFMAGNGVYLIDNEYSTILWIGQSVSPQVLQDLLGIDDLQDVDRTMVSLPRCSSLLSQQVHNILAHRFAQRGVIPKFAIARQNMDGTELEFSDMLVEDQNNAAMSYLDYLCVVHKQISTVLTTGGSLTGTGGLRGSVW